MSALYGFSGRILFQRAVRLTVFMPLLLTAAGCVSLPSPDAIPADAMRRPVDLKTVCVLENREVPSAGLLDAFREGAKRYGSEMKLLPQGAGPQACSFVIAYSAATEGRAVRTVEFQTFENSVPGIHGRGTAASGKALTANDVAGYMVEILKATEKRVGERLSARQGGVR